MCEKHSWCWDGDWQIGKLYLLVTLTSWVAGDWYFDPSWTICTPVFQVSWAWMRN